MDSVAESSWAPTQFYTSKRPSLATRLDLEPDPSFPENFVRTAKWYVNRCTSGRFNLHMQNVIRCSDGSSVLAHCENRTFQLLNMSVICRLIFHPSHAYHFYVFCRQASPVSGEILGNSGKYYHALRERTPFNVCKLRAMVKLHLFEHFVSHRLFSTLSGIQQPPQATLYYTVSLLPFVKLP